MRKRKKYNYLLKKINKIDFNDAVVNGLTFIFLILSIFLFIYVCNYIYGVGGKLDQSNRTKMQVDYYEFCQEINGLDFNIFHGASIELSSGEILSIRRTVKYPDDVILNYRNIDIEVENNNGIAKVVKMSDRNKME